MVRARAQAVNSNRVFIGDEFIKIEHTVVGQSSVPGYLCGGGFLRPSGPEVFRKISLLSPDPASFCVVHFWYICLSGWYRNGTQGGLEGVAWLVPKGDKGAQVCPLADEGVPAAGDRCARPLAQVCSRRGMAYGDLSACRPLFFRWV